jgi:immune inhibitor A
MWNNYVIEELWDYGFVEVSTDGGSTWTQSVVKDEEGNVVTTNEDPNGRLHDFGDLQNGLTGSTDGWRHDYIDVTRTPARRSRSGSGTAPMRPSSERGWFADDFALTNGDEVVWSDDVEGGDNGWTNVPGTHTNTTGAGWTIATGEFTYAHYYLAEWRNFDGFDKGLKYAYDTVYSQNGPWKVDKFAYNAPGMLLWYRDTTYGNDNHVLAHTFDLPSTGTKGGLLIVDSHFDPLRRKGEAAEKDPRC